MSESSLTEYVRIESAVVFEIAGEDRLRWLQNFCTADVANLANGSGCEAFILNVKGRTLAHVMVLALEDCIYLVAIGVPDTSLVDHLEKYVIREDVRIADISERCQLFWIDELVGPMFELPARPAESWSHICVRPGLFLAAAAITANRDWLLLDIDAESGERRAFEKAMTEVPASTFHQSRIKSCWPLNGVDLTTANFPQEFHRNERAISFTKGCYLGQETVARIDALGHVNQFLVTLELSSNEGELAGQELFQLSGDDKPIGRITSDAPDIFDHKVALAMVRRKFVTSGAEFRFASGRARLADQSLP